MSDATFFASANGRKRERPLNKHRMSDSFELKEYCDGNKSDLLAFIEKNPASPAATDLAGFFLDKIIPSCGRVYDLFLENQRVAAAFLIDGVENASNSAELFIVGLTASSRSLSIVEHLVSTAETTIRASRRRLLEIADFALIPGLNSLLTRRGYRLSYEMIIMDRTEAKLWPAPKSSLPTGWRWVPLTEELQRPYYEATKKAFRQVKGSNITDFESFCERNRDARYTIELLLTDKDLVAAFAKVSPDLEHPENGEIISIGRDPDCRGMGLGEHILARALELLKLRGFDKYTLSVNAENETALSLYKHFGFSVRESTPVLGLELRKTDPA
ncbi:MAG TPA: GNAT family N-acetyltransferase [Bdellovibrionota bacterium]|nr:GNAT family N-acetyltransferase [Bdellovibrionota bacterium]